VRAAGLVLEEISHTHVTGHLQLSSTTTRVGSRPWRRLLHRRRDRCEHRRQYGRAREGQIAVGLTNTTHFLRPLTSGRVLVDAAALNQGRTQQLWRVDLSDDSGRLIAHGEVRLQNVAAESANSGG